MQLSLSWVLNSHSGTHQCSSRALTSWQHSTAPQSVTVCPFWLESVCQPFNPDRSVPSLSRSLPDSLKALAQTKCSMVTHHPGPLTQHSEISYCLKVLIYFPQKWGRKEGKGEQVGEDILNTLSTDTYTFCHLAFCLLYYWSTSTTIWGLNLQLAHNLLCSSPLIYIHSSSFKQIEANDKETAKWHISPKAIYMSPGLVYPLDFLYIITTHFQLPHSIPTRHSLLFSFTTFFFLHYTP